MAKDNGTTFEDDPNFVVQGCPVADGQGPCSITCGGGWPGTNVTTEGLTLAVKEQAIDPSRLGCGTLEGRAAHGLRVLFERRHAAIEAPVEAATE